MASAALHARPLQDSLVWHQLRFTQGRCRIAWHGNSHTPHKAAVVMSVGLAVFMQARPRTGC